MLKAVTDFVVDGWLSMKTDSEPLFGSSLLPRLFMVLLLAVILLISIMAFNIVDFRPLTRQMIQSNQSVISHLVQSEPYTAEKSVKTNNADSGYGSNTTHQNESKRVILYFNRLSWISKTFEDLEKCPYKCEFTNDRKRWNESGAVVFIASGNPGVPKIKRPPGQAWVFLNLESPSTYRTGFQKWDKLINWTMTYRLDSDIMLLNHGIERKESNGYDPFNKTKPINWVASNCNPASRRGDYTKILQKYIQVDIYGKCGKLKMTGCKGYTNNTCWNKFFNKYRFYLSFENSFCRDYITEKAFNPLKSNIVPIVRGGAFYSKYFPPKSYVNTADFQSVKELADHLKFLIENEAEYGSYFDWRKHFVSNVYGCIPLRVCDLCRHLHHRDKYHRVYDSVHDWWHKGGNCHTAYDLHRRR